MQEPNGEPIPTILNPVDPPKPAEPPVQERLASEQIRKDLEAYGLKPDRVLKGNEQFEGLAPTDEWPKDFPRDWDFVVVKANDENGKGVIYKARVKTDLRHQGHN